MQCRRLVMYPIYIESAYSSMSIIAQVMDSLNMYRTFFFFFLADTETSSSAVESLRFVH